MKATFNSETDILSLYEGNSHIDDFKVSGDEIIELSTHEELHFVRDGDDVEVNYYINGKFRSKLKIKYAS